jgi:hypothetical protein
MSENGALLFNCRRASLTKIVFLSRNCFGVEVSTDARKYTSFYGRMRLFSVVSSLAIAVAGSRFASAVEKDLYFRWSSDGSAFRSMPLQMGYVNIFRQAGLITPTGTRFASISFTSAGAWFATQFFYSPQFFNKTTMSTPDELYDFTVAWMASYGKIYYPVSDFIDRGFDSLYAKVILEHEWSVYKHISSVLDITSNDYGDPDFPKRLASFDNRVAPLTTTDLYIANALHPNSRLPNGFGPWQKSLTYLGPSNSDSVYA